jgi:Na+-transporting methylmalonyl-CoA/oxaloacetate decarboxylase gamma subunit
MIRFKEVVFTIAFFLVSATQAVGQLVNQSEGQAVYRLTEYTMPKSKYVDQAKHSTQVVHFAAQKSMMKSSDTIYIHSLRSNRTDTLIMLSTHLRLGDSTIILVLSQMGKRGNFYAQKTVKLTSNKAFDLKLVGEETVNGRVCHKYTREGKYTAAPKQQKIPSTRPTQPSDLLFSDQPPTNIDFLLTYYCLPGVPNYQLSYPDAPSLPVKIVFESAGGGRTVIELVSLVFGSVDPAAFALPTVPLDYKRIDVK